MITLKPPVPTRDFEFELAFRPNAEYSHDQLMRLTSARRSLSEALIPLILEQEPAPETLQCAIQAAEAYRNRWLPFWQARIAGHASLAPQDKQHSTRVPLVFSWRLDVFGGAGNSTEYLDPSPLAETICATLALAICRHRAAAQTLGGPSAASEHFMSAETLLKWTQTTALPLFRPWLRTGYREPRFYSSAFVEAIELSVSGHSLCKSALIQSVRGEPAIATTVLLFRGAKRFQQAASFLPGETQIRQSQNRATSSAYRYLAQALADETQHMGIAVTCAREAARLCDKHREFATELENRNRTEAGWQEIPQLHQLSLVFSATAKELTIDAQDMAAIKIIIPLRA